MNKRIFSTVMICILAISFLSACNNKAEPTFSESSKDSPVTGTSAPTASADVSEKTNEAPKNIETETADMFIYEYDSENSGIKLTSYLGDKTQIRIPDEIEGYPVIGIDGNCFKVGTVTDVYYGEQLKYFEWGSNRKSELGTELIIPSGVTKIIGTTIFPSEKQNVKNITKISIPNTVTEIGEGAFCYFESLRNIDIPDSVTTIGDNAFSNCNSLVKIELPDSVTTIGDSAFSNCNSLLKIEIPDSVTNIESFAFDGTSWLNAQPDGLVYAGKVALKWKGEMPQDVQITLKNDTKGIATRVFMDSSLVSIIIPDSVITIGQHAFLNCTSLTNVTLSAGLITIGSESFYGCNSLTNIIIPDSVTTIEHGAFIDCSSLTSITLSNNLKTIGDMAFADCSSLSNITIPDSVTTIKAATFDGCTSLTSIIIPDSVSIIEYMAFYECSSLTSIIIPDTVTTIEEYTFYDCSSLTSIIIPNAVTTIGNYAFAGCSSLINITIPDTVTSIGNYAFSGCSLLSEETQSKIEKIAPNAFK